LLRNFSARSRQLDTEGVSNYFIGVNYLK